MKLVTCGTRKRLVHSAQLFVAAVLALVSFATSAGAQALPGESKAAPKTYQTLYITHATQQTDTNELITDLRNMLPNARLYGVHTQNAISIYGTPEDIERAQKILAEIDRPQKVYRLTYTLNETDNGKRVKTEHFTLIVASGGSTWLKQGNRVPIITGKNGTEDTAQNSQVQYVDVGLNIEASLDGMKLRTKVEQSSVADEKPSIAVQDPIIHQTTLQEVATLSTNKPLVLGSLDIPGSTRHQEVEVVAEPVP